MPINEEEKIKNIFQEKLIGLETPIEKDSWDFIEPIISKNRFYKFTPTNFNIYYASTIALTFLFSTFSIITILSKSKLENNTINYISSDTLLIKNTSEKKSINSQNITNLKHKERKLLIDADSINQQKNTTKILKEESSIYKKKNYSTINTIHNDNSLSATAPLKDSIKTVSNESYVQPQTIIRKKYYKIKQDTIVQYDTISESKKRKKIK